MSEFLLRRGFETVMVDALRVDHRDNMSYHSTFAGSVQPLQHDQHPTGVVRLLRPRAKSLS